MQTLNLKELEATETALRLVLQAKDIYDKLCAAGISHLGVELNALSDEDFAALRNVTDKIRRSISEEDQRFYEGADRAYDRDGKN